MYHGKHWKDLLTEEQDYFIRHSRKGSVAFKDLTKGCMPSFLYFEAWAIRCYYTFAFTSELQIFVDPDSPFVRVESSKATPNTD